MIDHALLAKAANLSPADRLELIGALWDTLPHAERSVTDEERRLLDARLLDAEQHPAEESPMSKVKRRLKPRSPHAFLAALFLVSTLAAPAAADLYDVSIRFDPSPPSTYQPATLLVEGESTDGCRPSFGALTIDQGEVDVVLYHPQFRCPAVLASWSVEVQLGELPPGDYSATVRTVWPPPFESVFPATTIGHLDFAVSERVGLRSYGVHTRRVVCKNLTSGQRVIVRAGGSATTNCEAAGLVIAPGDRVVIRIVGRVP
jgi:putative addiction module component (TIGR02574 family)